jgi:hypothetical protein
VKTLKDKKNKAHIVVNFIKILQQLKTTLIIFVGLGTNDNTDLRSLTSGLDNNM